MKSLYLKVAHLTLKKKKGILEYRVEFKLWK